MFLVEMILACGSIVLGQSSQEPGVIRGRVVNMSHGESPCAQTEVILRAHFQGQFVPVAQTLTGADGGYRFESLPVGEDYVYLPGANCGGIHYPGRRVSLTRGQPTAFVTLEVRDAVAEPCPLVIRQHEIAMETERGVVRVAEALLLDNPTSATYVGRANSKGMLPVTLQLHIPSDFERITFEKEKFGSQFKIIDGRLVTAIPWTPGPQMLKFTYTLRSEAIQGVWRRAMDAPCESLRVRVTHSEAEDIGCDLPLVAHGPLGEKVFQSGEGILPAGHEISVQLGRPPLCWSVYARWSALFLLAALVTGVAFVVRRTGRDATPSTADPDSDADALTQKPVAKDSTVRRSRRDHEGQRLVRGCRSRQ